MHRPIPSGGGHSLAELAIGGPGPDREGVEVGWRVSPVIEGDERPHLFVHRWRGGAPCWTDCGFVPWSGRWAPGDSLESFEGAEVAMGIALADGRWWIWFDGEWLGFFETADGPQTGASAQWYGEVFSPGPTASGQMGNGRVGSEPAAARITAMCQVLPGSWTCPRAGSLFPFASEPGRYPARLRTDELRYGGAD